MAEKLIARTPSACGYPLLIKKLFEAPLLKVKIVEAIDKTGVGKTNKVALRQKYL